MPKKLFRCYLFLICLLMAGCIAGFLLDREVKIYENTEQKVPVYGSVERTISLKPGVYEIIQKYRVNRDYAGMCTVEGQGRTNGEHFYGGRGQTGFLFWNWRESDALQVVATCDEADGEVWIGELVIRNTGKLWTILFTVLAFLLACSLLIRWLSVAGLFSEKRDRATVMALFVITATASIPLFCRGLLGGADLTYHLQRIEGVAQSLKNGQFPVRIEPQWLYDHGYANGIFYCNSLLYIPGILRLLGFTVTASYKVYCVLLNLFTAAVSLYCFGKVMQNRRIGVFCSALYTLSCPRIYKFMMVAAVGEGSAMSFLPLVFYGMYRVFTEDSEAPEYRRAWIPAALGYAGLMQTHVLTCEVTGFLTLIVCLICFRSVLRKKVFGALVKAALGAVGLSLWYLVPFLDYFFTQDMHIRHVSGRTIQERGLYFRQLFVNHWSVRKLEMLEQYGMTQTEQISAGLLFMVLLGIFLVLWIAGRWHRKEVQNTVAKIAAVLAVLCLTLSLRSFPWDRIQSLGTVPAALVSSLQFPYRFMGWGMVFLTVVAGRLFVEIKESKRGRLVTAVAVLFSIFSCSIPMMWHALQEENHLFLYNPEGMGVGYISGEEYLVEGTDASRLTFEGPAYGGKIRIDQYQPGSLSGSLTVTNEGQIEEYVDLPLLLYKGYRVVEPQEGVELLDGDNHKVRIRIPAGFSGKVQVRFVSPWYWRVSETISILVTAGVLVSGITRRRCRKAEE